MSDLPEGLKEFDGFAEFVDEFSRESDRAAAVLGAAKLDYLLDQILRRLLLANPTSHDELFDGDGPLSTFSSKINLSQRLGIIDADFARALHLIRKIRNAFAHELSGCSLETGAQRDRVRELVAPFESMDLYVSFKASYVSDKSGARADFRTILGLAVARLQQIQAKVIPVEVERARPLLLHLREK